MMMIMMIITVATMIPYNKININSNSCYSIKSNDDDNNNNKLFIAKTAIFLINGLVVE